MRVIRNLSTKQIIGIVITLAVVIFLIWYITYALKGFDPGYRPGMEGGFYAAAKKESFGNFDPTKKGSTRLSTTLSAICEFNSEQRKVSCNASRTSDKSTLSWSESQGANVSNQEEFEFPISDSVKSEILITLEECLNTACNEVQTSIDVSIQSP